MSSYIKDLTNKKIAHPPAWMPDCVVYEVITGSTLYGYATDESDMDIFGVCVPAKEVVFPHLKGEILDFGKQKERFSKYEEHHLFDQNAYGGKGKEFDLTCYNIVSFFQISMMGNPNFVETFFVPDNYVTVKTPISDLMRQNRFLFLHKGVWHTFKNYAFAQLKKISKKNRDESNKQIYIDKYGYDIKLATNVVKLLNDVEQILLQGDLNLLHNQEQLKSIRRGDWTEQQVKDYFHSKEKILEEAYVKSQLPWGPDEDKIKAVLFNCLECYYGNLDKCIIKEDESARAIKEIVGIIHKYKLN